MRKERAPIMAALLAQSPWDRSAGTSRTKSGKGAWGSWPRSMARFMACSKADRSWAVAVVTNCDIRYTSIVW